MSRDARAVQEAIDRWEAKGLVGEELAGTLRRESSAEAAAGAGRYGQYVLAATGAVILLIAGGVFVDWGWPLLSRQMRSLALALAGLAVHVAGESLEDRGRWRPAAYLMQTAGLGLLLFAAGYSESTWADRSVGGIVVGVLALGVPLVLAPRSFKRNVFMPAVHFCAGLAFLAIFLDRALSLSDDELVWTLDVVLLLATLVLLRTLARDPNGERHPWALNAFVAALYAGFALVAVTGLGPLGLDDGTVFPLDLWLFLVVALTLWGIHRAPEGLRRDWFTDQLGWAVLAWIPLGFWTAMGPIDGEPELAMVLVSGGGAAAMAYGWRHAARRVLVMGALAFVSGIWYWAVDRVGALGAVFALVATAALLFWVSGKTRESPGGPLQE